MAGSEKKMIQEAIELTEKLVAFRSETPASGAVFAHMRDLLKQRSFDCQIMTEHNERGEAVDSLFARHGQATPFLAFAGHLDVVSCGKEREWGHPPFSGHNDGTKIHGRGTVDMKSGVACFTAALSDFLVGNSKKQKPASVAILLSGDEEATGNIGMERLMESFKDVMRDCALCIMAEPTSAEKTGDMIKIGRRGSFTAILTVKGIAGHTAYPQSSENAAHLLVLALGTLINQSVDSGNAHFDASNLQIASLETENRAANIIPGEASALINIRYNDKQNAESLSAFIKKTISKKLPEVKITLEIQSDSAPFLTEPGPETLLLKKACTEITGLEPVFSTTGGTSDSRFITRYCPVVDFGLVGRGMHQYNESVALADIEALTLIYRHMLALFFEEQA